MQSAVKSAFPREIWVVGEIIKISEKNGSIYLELQDDEALKATKQVFSLRLTAWREKASYIQNKLKSEVGSFLQEKQRIRLKVKLDFHLQYSLSGTILDIDPQLTMGQIALLQKKIKEKFIKEGIYDLNKKLDSPKDYCRVVVIHPDNASGFHDFKKEADNMNGLCDFNYISSKFEGNSVEGDFKKTFEQALLIHKHESIDALVIIRGGGARHGLLSLVNESILKNIVLFPVPVILGVGHTDDKLLLDEIANISCGTPSKAIEHIRNIIYANAHRALDDINKITQMSQMILSGWRSKVDNNYRTLYSSANNSCLSKRNDIDSMRKYLKKDADMIMENIKVKVKSFGESVITGSRHKLAQHKISIKDSIDSIYREGEGAISSYIRNVDDTYTVLIDALNYNKSRIVNKLSQSYETIESLSPNKTISRGYALAFGKDGVIKDVITAKEQKEFTLRLSKGECIVKFKEEVNK